MTNSVANPSEYTIALSAGVVYDFGYFDCEFIAIKDAASPVQVSADYAPFSSLVSGEKVNGQFSHIRFLSAVGQTVKVVMGAGDYDSNKVTTAVSVTATVEIGNTLDPLAPVVIGPGLTAVIAGADPLQKELLISADAANAFPVSIGNAGVGAVNRGFLLEAASSVSLQTEAAVYGYNPGASAITVYACRNKKV